MGKFLSLPGKVSNLHWYHWLIPALVSTSAGDAMKQCWGKSPPSPYKNTTLL